MNPDPPPECEDPALDFGPGPALEAQPLKPGHWLRFMPDGMIDPLSPALDITDDMLSVDVAHLTELGVWAATVNAGREAIRDCRAALARRAAQAHNSP